MVYFCPDVLMVLESGVPGVKILPALRPAALQPVYLSLI